jgi:hypothetical protein
MRVACLSGKLRNERKRAGARRQSKLDTHNGVVTCKQPHYSSELEWEEERWSRWGKRGRKGKKVG